MISSSAVAADEPDDVFLGIVSAIDRADALVSSGQTNQAKLKYQEAQRELVNFRKSNPGWHDSVVTYRLNYVIQKVNALTPARVVTSEPAHGPVSTGSAVEGSDATTGVKIKLLDAGSEPRKVLRYQPRAGDKQTVNVTVTHSEEQQMGALGKQSMKTPQIKLPLDLTVKNVVAEGDISCEVVLGDASFADSGDSDAKSAAAIKAALKAATGALKGTSITYTMNNRGVAGEPETKLPAGIDPQAQELFEQLSDGVKNCIIPLPEEAIGPGAKWESREREKEGGVTAEQVMNFELVSLDGERVTARSAIKISAAAQKVENPSMPGMKVDLSKMTGSGSGRMTFNLGQIMPSESTLEVRIEAVMSVNIGSQKQTISSKESLSMQLESK